MSYHTEGELKGMPILNAEEIRKGIAEMAAARIVHFEGHELRKPYGSKLDIERINGKIWARSTKRWTWSHTATFENVDQLQVWLDTRDDPRNANC